MEKLLNIKFYTLKLDYKIMLIDKITKMTLNDAFQALYDANTHVQKCNEKLLGLKNRN